MEIDGEKLKKRMDSKGMNQADLASSSSLSIDTIGRACRSSKTSPYSPSKSSFKLIADAIDCEVSDLLFDDCSESDTDRSDLLEQVDYRDWHLKGIEFQRKAIFGSVTHYELDFLWTDYQVFVPYESILLRFIESGSELRRIFLLGGDVADPLYNLSFWRTTWRQHLLGFEIRLCPWADYPVLKESLPLPCDTFAVFYEEAAFFCEFNPEASAADMFRSVDLEIVNSATEVHRSLWQMSIPFAEYTKPDEYSCFEDSIFANQVKDEIDNLYRCAGMADKPD